jgi:GNAT superfamily N-acetyltransferase
MLWNHRRVLIRRAHEADAEQIGLIHVRSWQGAYQGLLPQDYLDQLDPARRAEGWRRALREAADVFVATDDTRVVGFVSFGPSRDADAAEAGAGGGAHVGEVIAIYLLPEAWGTGAGRQLMQAAVSRLASVGCIEATLWVLDTNARARDFYAKAGWTEDSAVQTDDSRGFPITEVRYRRKLPQIHLRPARPDEAAKLSDLAIRSKAHWGYDQAFLDACRPRLTFTDVSAVTVAEADGELRGFYALEANGELAHLWIDPAWIGTGIGRRLFRDAVERASAAGCTALHIDADPHSEGFYLAMGARRTGETPSPVRPGRTLPRLTIDCRS